MTHRNLITVQTLGHCSAEIHEGVFLKEWYFIERGRRLCQGIFAAGGVWQRAHILSQRPRRSTAANQ